MGGFGRSNISFKTIRIVVTSSDLLFRDLVLRVECVTCDVGFLSREFSERPCGNWLSRPVKRMAPLRF